MRRLIQSMLLLALGLSLSACWQTEQQKADLAEKKRIDCLDKICPGYDRDVPVSLLGYQTIKLNGQWYFSPKAYTKGFAGIVFYWPSKTPLTGRSDGKPYPEREQGLDYREYAIEIFLGHHSVNNSSQSPYARLQQAEKEGRVISKTTPRPGLEVWRVKDDDRKLQYVRYVATDFIDKDPYGAYMSCLDEARDPFCTNGFVWQPGVFADMRFHAKHALDWPEIYEETQRILKLIRKA